MKNVMGGYNPPAEGGTLCSDDGDCPSTTITCGGEQFERHGKCYANPGTSVKTCHWAGCVS